MRWQQSGPVWERLLFDPSDPTPPTLHPPCSTLEGLSRMICLGEDPPHRGEANGAATLGAKGQAGSRSVASFVGQLAIRHESWRSQIASICPGPMQFFDRPAAGC